MSSCYTLWYCWLLTLFPMVLVSSTIGFKNGRNSHFRGTSLENFLHAQTMTPPVLGIFLFFFCTRVRSSGHSGIFTHSPITQEAGWSMESGNSMTLVSWIPFYLHHTSMYYCFCLTLTSLGIPISDEALLFDFFLQCGAKINEKNDKF